MNLFGRHEDDYEEIDPLASYEEEHVVGLHDNIEDESAGIESHAGRSPVRGGSSSLATGGPGGGDLRGWQFQSHGLQAAPASRGWHSPAVGALRSSAR